MTVRTGFAGTDMLWLVRQQELEFNTLPFAGFRERKGVFLLAEFWIAAFLSGQWLICLCEKICIFSGWMDKFA